MRMTSRTRGWHLVTVVLNIWKLWLRNVGHGYLIATVTDFRDRSLACSFMFFHVTWELRTAGKLLETHCAAENFTSLNIMHIFDMLLQNSAHFKLWITDGAWKVIISSVHSFHVIFQVFLVLVCFRAFITSEITFLSMKRNGMLVPIFFIKEFLQAVFAGESFLIVMHSCNMIVQVQKRLHTYATNGSWRVPRLLMCFQVIFTDENLLTKVAG